MTSRPSIRVPHGTDEARLAPPARPGQSGFPPPRKPRRDALTRVRHDLRSLVHSMIGYSDLLSSSHFGALSPEQTRFVGHVRSAASQLRELVDTCIELSRPSEGHTPEWTRISAAALARRVQGALLDHELACAVDVDANSATRMVLVDLPALERALLAAALVVTRAATTECTLQIEVDASDHLHVRLSALGAPVETVFVSSLDELESEADNRAFVRLKLCELLLSRQHIALQVSTTLDAVVLQLPTTSIT